MRVAPCEIRTSGNVIGTLWSPWSSVPSTAIARVGPRFRTWTETETTAPPDDSVVFTVG